MNKEEILKKIKERLPILKEKYHVKEIGIFGSATKGEETENSDIDILVEFSIPIGFFNFIRLENFLSEILGKKVDLVTKKAIKPVIKEEILKETVYV
ncbi:MAG: polymerase beta domain protein region protein [Parcubacteria group bacterium GW2011_GWB1_41_6]|nr:MAG: polymerase beta domain protein region protein [Parcubacteria group bacterium GW2011_GWB1_41_6]KKS34060.1 MAG: polymerase beta domain protein region protein [Parcubacteria group bacterium GW2011_GWC2_42_13]KKS56414.1 MAG: polymerase beta domain protein region protein [Parcubacteria group bacterium GW2011_GWA2_42_35]